MVCDSDFIMAALAWICFYFVRSALLHDRGAYPISYLSWSYILAIVPAAWLDYLHLPALILRSIKSQGWQNSPSPLFAVFLVALFSFLFLCGMTLTVILTITISLLLV